MTVPEDGLLATIPKGWSFGDVAAATEEPHYVVSFFDKAKVASGQAVLVNGATGAIGSAALQLLKNPGVNVTAICATEHISLVKDLGADRVIDYTVEDFTQDNQTHDLVMDAVGKSTFGRCRQLLKLRGIYVSSELGPFLQNPVLALITFVMRAKKVVFPVPKHDQEMVRHFKRLIKSGEFKPLIDRRYRLDQIVDSCTYVKTGQKVGNVVISIEPELSESP